MGAPVPVATANIGVSSEEGMAVCPQPPFLVRRGMAADKGWATPPAPKRNLSFSAFLGERNLPQPPQPSRGSSCPSLPWEASPDIMLPQGFSFGSFLENESFDLGLPGGVSFGRLLDMSTDETASVQ